MRRLCAVSGCTTPPGPSGRCTEHRRQQRHQADQQRPTAADRGYDHHWSTVTSPTFLAAHPWCVDCGKPSQVADHAPLTRQQLVTLGDPNPNADHHLQARCKRCHSTKTNAAWGDRPSTRTRKGGV